MNKTQEMILNKLGELWKLFPQERFGQLIDKYILDRCPNNNCFFIEDDEFLKLLTATVKRNEVSEIQEEIKKLEETDEIKKYLNLVKILQEKERYLKITDGIRSNKDCHND